VIKIRGFSRTNRTPISALRTIWTICLPAVLHLLEGLLAMLHLLEGLPAMLHLLAGLPAEVRLT
jgi:hypothetical protein